MNDSARSTDLQSLLGDSADPLIAGFASGRLRRTYMPLPQRPREGAAEITRDRGDYVADRAVVIARRGGERTVRNVFAIECGASHELGFRQWADGRQRLMVVQTARLHGRLR